MRILTTTLVCLAAIASAPSHAAWGQFDSFGASATQVVAGSTVDFLVGYTIGTNAWQSGGSNPVEPLPEDGYQSWEVNWYYTEAQTLQSVWLEAAGQSFGEFPSLAAGSSFSGAWSFSQAFHTPGTYQISLSGNWTHRLDIYSSSESASRNCWYDDYDDPSSLRCDAWTWEYSDYSDWWEDGGSLDGRSLTIEVSAVPEPHRLILGLAGLAVLAIRRRRVSAG